MSAFGSTTSNLRKGHGRKESSGHTCSACDQCYRCKVKCTGERPACERCQSSNSACTYSTGKPLGKPKGSKNKVQRTKMTLDAERQGPVVAPAVAPQLTSPPSAPSRKRPSDGDNSPQRKRVLGVGSHAGNSTAIASFTSPKFNTPEMTSSAISITRLHYDRNHNLSVEPVPYYSDLAGQDDSLSHVLEHSTPTDMENMFPSVGSNLDIDDYWFAQPGSYTSGTPSSTTINHLAHPDTIAVVPSHQTNDVVQRSNDAHTSDMISTSGPRPQPPPCLCDPLSLGIISELYTLQLSYLPLDTALLLARRGLSTVSSYLACPSCLNHLSSSPSLFLACVLILQQVFTCYLTLRMHGTRMLATLSKQDDTCHRVAIGDFEVEGEESCHALLDAIVRAEMEKGKGVIGGLEQWMEKVGDGKDKMVSVLLQSLREEIGGGY
ncbi:Copper amine oxidase 1 [Venturia nashicola]|uniref:Copper amine oxidase 1 n=1 Tax=Venturia nashicola TaxID=86259 RepID=A0A4Z1P575_9PEZI|nr:Copper amine oxidase 1 [Venturia nashicola]